MSYFVDFRNKVRPVSRDLESKKILCKDTGQTVDRLKFHFRCTLKSS